MLCQHCNKRIANVHFTQVINNNKVELYLCEQCAKEKGQFKFGSQLGINDFFSGLINFGNPVMHIPSVSQQLVCDKCKTSYEEFQKSGKFGCSSCYEAFAERINPIIKRLHGDTEHHGKVPARISDSLKMSRQMEELKNLLNEAIKNEQYEKAAELRDKIKSLEVGK